VVLGSQLLIGRSPRAVEVLHVEGLGWWSSRAVGLLTRWFPFSVAEFVQVGLGALALWWIVGGIRAVVRRERRPSHALASFLLWTTSSVLVGFALFYTLWGLSYLRSPAKVRLGLEYVDPGRDPDAWAELGAALVDESNRRYRAVNGGARDSGAPSAPLAPVDFDAEIDGAYERVGAQLGLHDSFSAPRGPAKRLLSSTIYAYVGISGVYFPFTAEAQYNSLPPLWQRPHTIAHEKAHQRFIASEDEANFFGVLSTIYADDPFVRYAGWMSAQRQILRVLFQVDPYRARMLVLRRDSGVQRDVDASRDFWRQYRGRGQKLGHAVNDAYLKMNRVKGGTKAYGRASKLITAWGLTQADFELDGLPDGVVGFLTGVRGDEAMDVVDLVQGAQTSVDAGTEVEVHPWYGRMRPGTMSLVGPVEVAMVDDMAVTLVTPEPLPVPLLEPDRATIVKTLRGRLVAAWHLWDGTERLWTVVQPSPPQNAGKKAKGTSDKPSLPSGRLATWVRSGERWVLEVPTHPLPETDNRRSYALLIQEGRPAIQITEYADAGPGQEAEVVGVSVFQP